MQKLHIFFLLVFIAFAACKKTSSDCTPVDWSNYDYSPQVYEKDFVHDVKYNPANDNEVFALMRKNGNPPFQLYKIDITIGTNTLVFQDDKFFSFNVSPDGKWIVVYGIDLGFSKMKSNGDSLQQVNGLGSVLYPSFNTNTTFSYHSDGTGYLLGDLQGNILDTLTNHPAMSSFVYYINDSVCVAKNYTTDKVYLSTYNIKLKAVHNIKSVTPGSVVGPVYMGNNVLVWGDNDGVYQTNMATAQTTTIFAGCSSNKYLGPTVNTTRTKICWNNLVTIQEGNTMSYKSKIIISSPAFNIQQTITKPDLQ